VIPDAVERALNRRVTDAEVRRELTRTIPADEREEVLSLVQWFTRRYASPEARLAYVRRAPR
jgi:hypothetical protein